MIGIYKITNKLNGKSYIGQSIHCGKRLDEHYRGSQFIDKIIKSEGIENFTYEILKETSKEDLSKWEDYYIIKYDTMFPKGYNKKWNNSLKIRIEFYNSIENHFYQTQYTDQKCSSDERKIEALMYGCKEKIALTNKQLLIYSYLLSISKIEKDNQYYVYKNSFVIKQVCDFLDITQPTWRSAIKKLAEKNYLKDCSTYYIIEKSREGIFLNINLIKFLSKFGSKIDSGGYLPIVYSTIYRYWKMCKDNNDGCEITINQLKSLFNVKRNKDTMDTYKLMLNIFEWYDLIEIERVGKEYKGKPYTAYIIKNVSLSITDKTIDFDENGPDDVSDIVKSLTPKKEED